MKRIRGGERRIETIRKRRESSPVENFKLVADEANAETEARAVEAAKEKKKKRPQTYLKPKAGKMRTVNFFTFDIESKDGDSQAMGFTRPFAVGFFDGETYVCFKNGHGGSCDPCHDSPRDGQRRSVCHDVRAASLHRQVQGSQSSASIGAGESVHSDRCSPCTSTCERIIPWQELHLVRGSGCIDKFLRFLFQEGKEDRSRFMSKAGQIYGHNAGKFDLLFVIGWLLRNRADYDFSIAAVQSRVQRLDVWPRGSTKKKGHWSFLDSVSLMPMTLEKVGTTFAKTEAGNENTEGFVKRKINLNLHEAAPEWEEYLRDDCRTLLFGLRAYQKMIATLGGEIGITAPATAMNLFRRAFQTEWIYIGKHFPGKDCDGKCHRNEIDVDGFELGCPREENCDGSCHGCLHDFIRSGYYGGRTELVRASGRNLLYYDINSSYPASMREAMPIGKPIVVHGGDWKRMAEIRKKGYIGFLECEVEIPKGCKLPPLPYRVEEGKRVVFKQPDGTETLVPPGKLIFPTGKLRGVWDFDELALLKHPLVRGNVTKVIKSVWYAEKPIFVDFVDVLYAFRNKSDPRNYARGVIERDDKGRITNDDEFNAALAETCKLMLNALYGKFGMKEERTGLSVVLNPEDGPSVWPASGWPIDGDHDKCLVWEVEHVVNAPYIVPQISAHITALSRMRLWRGMADVVQQGGVVFYCDTDSIMTNVPIPESKLLGGWKLENPPDALLSGEFVLPKMYQLGFHERGCVWMNYGYGPPCKGCKIRGHEPDCPKVRSDGTTCPGCATSKQVMKGVGGKAKTRRNWDRMTSGLDVEFERLSQHRTMLNSATSAEKIEDTNHRTERVKVLRKFAKIVRRNGKNEVVIETREEWEEKYVGPLLSPVVVTAKKSLRTRYDKRQLQRDGSTIAIHIE